MGTTVRVVRQRLDQIRKPEKGETRAFRILCSVLILVLGIGLGILAKWLDNISVEEGIWWQSLIDVLDLGNLFSEFAVWLLAALAIAVYSRTPLWAGCNVFLFLTGMCVSYHLWTILFSGFHPSRYMMIWYGFALASPVLAVLCWYGKGKTKVSLFLDILILTAMFHACFSIGFWYFDGKGIVDTLLFLAAVFVLHSTPKHTAASVLGAFLLSFGLRLFW